MIVLRKTGIANLPLHYGRAPHWLISRMIKLADAIVTIIIDEYGQDEFLQRISDTFWFQALGCVLGFDWHSSGVTTVLTYVLKKAVRSDMHGIAVCGGKGKASLRTPSEIRLVAEKFGFSNSDIDQLEYSSKMSAKVDNTAIQAGYPLYHHAFFLSEEGKWAVVQQGMSIEDRTARRYHWISDSVNQNFVDEPHKAIVGDTKRGVVLDMTAKKSVECRKTSLDICKENPLKVRSLFESIRPARQSTLQHWIQQGESRGLHDIRVLSMPRRVNWNVLREVYEFQPSSYEELLGVRGVGPATVRGLALVSEIIYGKPPSWRDPVKFSFAYGGKDGVPRPVDREAMDQSIELLRESIQKARVDEKTKSRSLKKLTRYITNDNLNNH